MSILLITNTRDRSLHTLTEGYANPGCQQYNMKATNELLFSLSKKRGQAFIDTWNTCHTVLFSLKVTSLDIPWHIQDFCHTMTQMMKAGRITPMLHGTVITYSKIPQWQLQLPIKHILVDKMIGSFVLQPLTWHHYST